jgi:acyl-CoA reductase-like NAD-dependent aldehyde dehydrogenase
MMDSLMEKVHINLFINNEWVEGELGDFLPVENPSTLEIVGTVAQGTRRDAQRALAAAQDAFESWSHTSGEQRSVLLKKAADAVLARQEELARLLTSEHGKPLNEAQGEVKGSTNYLVYYAEEAKRISGEVAPSKSVSSRSLIIKQPRGVVAAIAPWNYPIALMMWKVAPALAAGCTVVIKPPAITPLATTLFAAIVAEVGFPPGVINVINGPSSEVGDELISNPITKVVGFTGSTATGAHIASRAAPGFKKLILELGGHTPMIIFKDADMKKAVADGVKRSFRNMGQICNAINRIYVEREIADDFIQQFAAAAEKLTIGDGLENPKIDLGPMTSKGGIDHTQMQIDDAVSKGARLLCGGKRPSGEKLPGGYFYEPSVVTNVTREMRVMHEETFGPLVAIDTFSGLEEAIEKANSTSYGLVSYVYTSNLSTAFRMMEEVHSGTVAINNISPDSIYAPYPAWKDSGIGLELGRYGLDEYLQVKHCILEI